MAELCVGVGMGRRLPLFIGEILGPSKGQFLFWGSWQVHFSAFSVTRERNFRHEDDTFIYTHFYHLNKRVGNQNNMKYKRFIAPLKTLFSVSSQHLCVNWMAILASHQSFWRTKCTFTYSFSWCFLNSFHHFKNRISSSSTKIVDLQAQQNDT